MKRKKLFISLTAILSFIIALSIFLGVWYLGDRYEVFEKDFTKEFEIPGLREGAVPQGMGNCELSYNLKDENGNTVSNGQQYFFISAYMTDGSPSRIYVTGGDTGYVGYVTMKNTDGTDYTGHCGGIAANNNGSTVWVTGEGTVYVARSSENKDNDYNNTATEIIEKAQGKIKDENGNVDRAINFTASFDANCNADFCYYYDDPRYVSLSYDKLYVGEFYRKGAYETDGAHRVTTPNGYKNYAFMYEYAVNSDATSKYGLTTLSTTNATNLNEEVPRIYSIFSIPEKVQGMAVAGNNILLSQSYGLANSAITVFDKNKAMSKSDKYKELKGKDFAYKGVYITAGGKQIQYYDSTELKVYYLDCNDKEMLKQTYSIPSMSEGLCTVSTANSSRVYVLFESASKKYKTFVREQLSNVYSVRIKN